ncbi:MAG: hypothetical protein M3O30_16055 [Planctomycetota bacterium]|nr:hypothetical protein [Planctomycetota bacterium]
MTTTSAPPARQPVNEVVAANRRGRIAVVSMLIISLIASGLTRQWAMDRRTATQAGIGTATYSTTSQSSLNALPSFATALLLGGLRGPLVMVLWPMTERQKQERNLEDLDTEIEWIRLLQPEFDTVHLFQIWNKAYNLTVQMSSLANKYAIILDALDYAQKVDEGRHDDINIILTVASIYDNKLGTSGEHVYYRGRIRRETQTLMRVTFPDSRVNEFRALALKLGWIEEVAPLNHSEKNHTSTVYLEPAIYQAMTRSFSGSDIVAQPDAINPALRQDPTWQRGRLDPMLDIDGNILPQLLKPRFPRPADLAADQPWYDGSRLQFLARYQPFPYGLSSLALAYNDSKRSQMLLNLHHQHPIQAGSTDPVVDSRPGITLEHWITDEWERARRFELRMVGQTADSSLDPDSLEIPDGKIGLHPTVVDETARKEASYSYRLAIQLCVDAIADFQEHTRNFPQFAPTYFSHLDDVAGEEEYFRADADYLAAMSATGEQRKTLLGNAANHYNKAASLFALSVLKYYVDDAVISKTYPKDPRTGQQYSKATIGGADEATILQTFGAVEKENKTFFLDPKTNQYSLARDQHVDFRTKYETYMQHCAARLGNIRSELPLGPTAQ